MVRSNSAMGAFYRLGEAVEGRGGDRPGGDGGGGASSMHRSVTGGETMRGAPFYEGKWKGLDDSAVA
jgi:hypothetical protein